MLRELVMTTGYTFINESATKLWDITAAKKVF